MARKERTTSGADLWSEVQGFVLAGGQSSRMGKDKALVSLGGRPLVEHALGVLHRARLEAIIAGGAPALKEFAPLIPDAARGRGPLSGICAALEACSAPLAAFVPVDQPLMPDSVLPFLIDHAQQTGAAVTVLSVNGFAETFPAVIARATLPALRRELEMGTRGCFSAFRTAAGSLGLPICILPVEILVQTGNLWHSERQPAAIWFLNVNTPAGLRRAESLLAAAVSDLQ